MKRVFYPFALSALIFTVSSCKKDKAPVNEEELITTVKLRFNELGTTTVNTFVFRDIDGEGGNAPTSFEQIQLAPNKTYLYSVELLNESVSPADTITKEVIAEAGDHQFYFEPTGVPVTVSNLNTDPGGLPLGTTATWTTGATTATGTVRITLKHKPGVKAAGDPVTKGETDIQLDWATRVQ